MSDDTKNKIEKLAIDTIRTLSMEAVQAANSGHPGTPMALAPVAYLLYNEMMNYDPEQPAWPARDRFVLSCGHASTLLYSVLHLAGVKQLGEDGKPTDELAVPLDAIRNFRQFGSRCPGHPEWKHTSGVEITTGPLGQGVASSVGMAIASRWLAANYDQPGYELFGFNTYAVCGDGDMMEGVSSEAASFAGHLKLSNLCWIYDDNNITIEGSTSLAFSENVAARFASYGWNVLEVEDINDLDSMRGALQFAKESDDAPTLIITHTVIGYGSPAKAGTAAAHGAPLGEDEIRATKEVYGLDPDAQFAVADDALALFRDGVGARGKAAYAAWQELFEKYKEEHADLACQFEKMRRGELPEGWDTAIEDFPVDDKGIASRVSSGKVLNQIAKNVPWLLGGSADLAPSTKSEIVGDTSFTAETPAGRNFHFGIREHAMGSICNGMALSGLRTYGSTFFVFVDYMRPSMRMAALMGLPVFYIMTHDSIGVGEDGPTHQPVEQLASLRAIPNLAVMRPSDANEVVSAYKTIMQMKDQPVVLALTRQNLPTIDREKYAAPQVDKGAYVLADCNGTPDIILIATGSEVALCVDAYEQLTANRVKARIVSMPCCELFDAQSDEYRNSVLPPECTSRVAVEAAIELGWRKYIGDKGKFVGMDGYGKSAPQDELMKLYGFTVENVVATAKSAM